MERRSYNTSSKRIRHSEISTAKKSDNIHIPLDLTVEILKKLPAKSLVRFKCVSKQWSNIIGSRRDFIDSIVARSREPMRLIFHHHLNQYPTVPPFFIFASTYPHENPLKQGISIPGIIVENYAYVRGLILCWSCVTFSSAIYNPTTRQGLLLPKIDLFTCDYLYNHVLVYGYDPVKNHYKVLCLVTTSEGLENTCLIFTLRDRTKLWRKIQSGIEHHYPWLPAVCIDGVIYYRGTKDHGSTFFLVSFDVRSEKFSLVDAPKDLIHDYKESTLINYHGKLGFVCYEKGVDVWVMEDAKKQEWSMVREISPKESVTHGDDQFVFVNKMVVSPGAVYVTYSNPERGMMQLREIQGTSAEERERKHIFQIWGVPNHVENTMCLY